MGLASSQWFLGHSPRAGCLMVVWLLGMALFITTLVTAGVILVGGDSNSSGSAQQQFSDARLGHVLVADAGSSHTDFVLYRWRAPESNETANVIELCCAEQVEYLCEINALGTDPPSKVREDTEACLDEARNLLTDAQFNNTPFLLRATAGMRLLEKSNSSFAQEILEAVRDASALQPILNAGEDNVALILPGADEGAFGWVASNYLEGTLNPVLEELARSGSMDAVRNLQTTGALDLGGASTQITYIPGINSSVSEDDSVRLTLYNNDIDLYTHSYLCYGINQARERRTAALLSSAQDQIVVDPCLPSGYNVNLTKSKILEMQQNACLNGYLDNVVAQDYQIYGDSFDAVACNASIAAIFDLDTGASGFESFAEGRSRQPQFPKSPVDVYAFSAYWFTVEFLFMGSSIECINQCSPSLNEIMDRAEVVCNLTLNDLELKYPEVRRSFLPQYCNGAFYIVHILEQYGVARDQKNIVFAGSVNSVNVGWDFGLALNATTDLPSLFSPLSTNGNEDSNIVLVLTAGIAGAMLVLLIVYGLIQHKRSMERSKYINLDTSDRS